MHDQVTDRYVILTSRYGDAGVQETLEDAEVVDRMVPRYDDGTLHDAGCIVRERGGDGRYGLLVSEGLAEGHEADPEALARVARAIGLQVAAFRDTDPPHRPEVTAFLPLDDARIAAPEDVVQAIADLASEAPLAPGRHAMPDGVAAAEAHACLKGVLERASVANVFMGRALGTATDGGALARAWALYADLRGTGLDEAVSAVVGRDREDWTAAITGDGPEVHLTKAVTAERVTDTFEGLVVHAEAYGWRDDCLGRAWTLLARMRDATPLEVAEDLLGAQDATVALDANGCDACADAPRP